MWAFREHSKARARHSKAQPGRDVFASGPNGITLTRRKSGRIMR